MEADATAFYLHNYVAAFTQEAVGAALASIPSVGGVAG